MLRTARDRPQESMRRAATTEVVAPVSGTASALNVLVGEEAWENCTGRKGVGAFPSLTGFPGMPADRQAEPAVSQ